MASKYCYSGAGGAGTGADWANAYTSLVTAFGGISAGDFVYLASDHSQTQASQYSLNSPGTAAAPCKIISVNRAGSTPPVSADLTAGAQILTTGATGIEISDNGSSAWWQGITFQFGSSAGYIQTDICVGGHNVFKSCTLNFLNTSASDVSFGGMYNVTVAGRVDLYDCTVRLDVSVTINCEWTWKGGSLSAMGATNMFTSAGSKHAPEVLIEGVDLSVAGSGKTLVAAGAHGHYTFRNCRLNASVTMAATPTTPSGRVDVLNCNSGTSNTRNERYRYEGTETTETTIVRTGGATDGATPTARKYVTTANAKWHKPFDALPIMVWNDQVGSSITVTMYGIWGGGSVPNNDDIWLEITALENSSYPLATIETTSKADILATGSGVSSDASSWGGSTTAFKITKSFTPQIKGPILIQPRIGAASATIYLDPEPEVTGVSAGSTYPIGIGFVNQLASAGGGLLQGNLRGNMQ
jgi:hypothetical protein